MSHARLIAVMGGGALLPVATALAASDADWPSYNRTLTSERYAPHSQVTRDNVGQLTIVCRYDTRDQMSLQTGPVVIGGVLYGDYRHRYLCPGCCHLPGTLART